MTIFQRIRCHYLWHKGHSVPHIAYRLGCTMPDVERVLGIDTPSRAASELAKHGAAMRRESERAKRLRVMNELREQLGLPEWKV